MGALKGYFDESGKENDPQFADGAISVAGYVTTFDSWRDIEVRWSAVLKRPEFDVPYLHMREFSHSKTGSPFEDWKGDESRRADFIGALADVIRQSDLAGVGAVVRVPDLARFNREHNLEIQAYPFAVYACLIELSRRYADFPVETVWDKVNRHATQIDVARDYAKSDLWNPGCGENVAIAPLEKRLSSKTIPALQIADLAAYELLKSHRDKNDWFLNEEPFLHPSQWFKSQFDRWHSKAIAQRKTSAWPDERKSYLALFSGPIVGQNVKRPMEGKTWTYNSLVRCHCARRGVWSEVASTV